MPADKRLEDENLLKNVEDITNQLNNFITEQGYKWVLVDMPPNNKTINQICFSQIVNNIIAPFSSDIFSIDGYADLMEIVNQARAVNENI